MKVSELFDRILWYVKNVVAPESDKKILRFKIAAYKQLIDRIRKAYALSDVVTFDTLIAQLKPTHGMTEHLHQIMTMSFESTIPRKTIVLRELAEINGIGEVLAQKLYDTNKVRSLSDLMKPEIMVTLPLESQTFLKYPPLRLIPHDTIVRLEKQLLAEGIFKGTKHTIVGSYRRKKQFSRDVDTMIVSDSPESLQWVVSRLKETDFKFHIYSHGPDKVSGILTIPALILGNPAELHLKLDFFRTPTHEESFMLLYSTGSKEFNLRMRAHAKRKGLLLNQKGLYYQKTKKPVNSNIKTEKQIFIAIGMEYIDPPLRI